MMQCQSCQFSYILVKDIAYFLTFHKLCHITPCGKQVWHGTFIPRIKFYKTTGIFFFQKYMFVTTLPSIESVWCIED